MGRFVVLFLVSGFSGLLYEVTWFRWLSLVLGSATLAAGIVLAAFLAGMALGGALLGGHADRVRRPLLLYGGLEILVALAALAAPFLFSVADSIYLAHPSPSSWWRGLLAMASLLVPTGLMGATYPVMNRCLIRRPSEGPRGASLVYALQTLGAALGAVMAGFVLLEAWGLRGTLVCGAALSGTVGLVAVAAGWKRVSPMEFPPGRQGWRPTSWHLAVTLVGASALALQVLYTRVLVFHLPTHTYSFAAVLGVHLLALSLGGWLARVAIRVLGGGRAALVTGGLGGLLAIASLWVPQMLPTVLEPFRAAGGGMAGGSFVLGSLCVSAVLVLPAAVLLGAFLPLAVAATTLSGRPPGSSSGGLWALNSLGAAFGALLAGGPLVPWLGVRGGIAAAGLLAVLAGCLGAGRGRRIACLVLLFGAAGLAALAPLKRPLILDAAAMRGVRGARRKMVAYREGAVLGASVIDQEPGATRLLYTDAFQAAATGATYRYMKVLGHLPMLLARRPRRALCIAFGTGTTAGSMIEHGRLERLDLAEIAPEVLELAPFFRAMNGGLPGAAATSCDVHLFVDDGRDVLRRAKPIYDVITLEPFLPHMPAAVPFYTVDFYRLVRARLAPGGVLCGWIPLGGETPHTLGVLLASFAQVFPEGALFVVEESLLLVGFEESGEAIDVARLENRLAENPVAADMAEIGLRDAAALLGQAVGVAGDVCRMAGRFRPMDDFHPAIEFQRPRPHVEAFMNLAHNLGLLIRARASGIPELLDLSSLTPEARARFLRDFPRVAASHLSVMKGQQAAALETYQRLTGRVPDLWRELGRLASNDLFELALQSDPDNEAAARRLGRHLASAGEIVRWLESGRRLSEVHRLGTLSSRRVRRAFGELLDRLETGESRPWVARALGVMGPVDQELTSRAIESLRRNLLDCRDEELAAAQLVALFRLGDTVSLDTSLRRESARLGAAIEALAELRDRDLAASLVALFDDDRLDIRLHVLVALQGVAGATFGYDPYRESTWEAARQVFQAWCEAEAGSQDHGSGEGG